ncbi:hypothetical protein JTE90_009727 [Oedothorax gibbosus]|uniref:Secreted protein n=1 Tax=Oedothorax gibbosus TaxID=931172 RepID=A0AAV6V7N4_9ARAC|nr:hypothetical protein JTE90_009727 [Oedothorax gibbosus]
MFQELLLQVTLWSALTLPAHRLHLRLHRSLPQFPAHLVYRSAEAMSHQLLHMVKQYLSTVLDSCLTPCCSEMGTCLSRIKVGRYEVVPNEVV